MREHKDEMMRWDEMPTIQHYVTDTGLKTAGLIAMNEGEHSGSITECVSLMYRLDF
jgi:hypothetical protein